MQSFSPPGSHGTPYSDVTGIILAGGKSARMGRDKATLQVNGQSLFDRILSVFRRYFNTILIAGERPDLEQPDVPSVPDLYPGSSLGGLYTALTSSKTPYIFVAPCDMPWPAPEIIESLLEKRHGHDVIIPRTPSGFEPLFGLYSRNCLEPMKRMLDEKRYRIFDFYPQVRTLFLDPSDLPANWSRSLTNINTPQDFQRITEQNNMTVPVVSIVSKSGSGKTTLLEKLIAELTKRGYKVGVLKHDSHQFEIDHEGKDSWRLTQAGAATTVITSPAKIAMVKKHAVEPPIEETVNNYFTDTDIVLTEGFKRARMPKIEVHRAQRSPAIMCRGEEHDPTLIAVASDSPWELDVPLFDLNDFEGICSFIEDKFLK